MNRTDPVGGTPDPLAGELAGLAADAPPALLDRIAARRVHVPGPLEGLQVAFTDQGVAYLRAGMDEREFAAA